MAKTVESQTKWTDPGVIGPFQAKDRCNVRLANRRAPSVCVSLGFSDSCFGLEMDQVHLFLANTRLFYFLSAVVAVAYHSPEVDRSRCNWPVSSQRQVQRKAGQSQGS